MKSRMTILGTALALAALAGAVDAQSYERSWSDGTATVTAEGAQGGTATRSTACGDGRWRCSTEFSVTGPNGRTVEGTRNAGRGPFRGRSVTTVTGPRDNVVVRPSRWRR